MALYFNRLLMVEIHGKMSVNLAIHTIGIMMDHYMVILADKEKDGQEDISAVHLQMDGKKRNT